MFERPETHPFAQMFHRVGIELHKKPYLFQHGGRILGASAVSYVTKGHGWFESRERGRQIVKPGTLLIQPAGVWHCHDPDPETTWSEYWILFRAGGIEPLFGDLALRDVGAVHIGVRNDLVTLWNDTYAAWPAFGPGRLEDACLLAHRLLHTVFSAVRQQSIHHHDDRIRDADSRIRAMIHDTFFDGDRLATDLGMSYHHFRRLFQQKIGVGPKQYWLRMRMERAAELLTNTGMSVAEAATAVGYDDAAYFSRLFKRIMSTSPGRYRRDPGPS